MNLYFLKKMLYFKKKFNLILYKKEKFLFMMSKYNDYIKYIIKYIFHFIYYLFIGIFFFITIFSSGIYKMKIVLLFICTPSTLSKFKSFIIL